MGLRKRKPISKRLRSFPGYLLIFAIVLISTYAMIDKLAHLDDNLGLLISFKPTVFGVYVGGISFGYLSIGILLALGVATIASRHAYGLHFSMTKVSVVLVLGLLLGTAVAETQTAKLQPVWLNHVSDSSGGFTLNVYYNSTTFTNGNNVTFEYILKNDAYTTTLYYIYFGGQFSMVFYNSTGQQVTAFKVPISFLLAQGQDSIAFASGQTWTTLLSWDGSVSKNGTSSFAPAGNYTLASYAVLQDANASLYVVLHTPDLHINLVTA